LDFLPGFGVDEGLVASGVLDALEDHGAAVVWTAVERPEASLEQRLEAYAGVFHCNARTALQRSDRGIEVLAAAVRDGAEQQRPVGMVWLFQSGAVATVVLDFLVDRQSVRPPVVAVDGQVVSTPAFVGHRERDGAGRERFRARIVLDGLAVAVDAGAYQPCLSVRVVWDMPVWPLWQLTGWVVDPHYLVRLETFRQRAVEVCLLWRQDTATVGPVVGLHEGLEGSPALS
jgi:hypothetical protein avisC_04816